jgi:phage gpG-like protein
MNQQNKPPNFSAIALKIKKGRPRVVAIEAAKFFKDCFVKGGFTDESFDKWADGTSPLRGKKTLIGYRNTMNLMQSIRTLEETDDRVRTGTQLVYSEIHNDGGIITVTKKMKGYWWLKYAQLAGIKMGDKKKGIKTDWDSKTTTRKTKNAQANVNAKAEFCRNMALMPVGKKIKIPRRKYIGESKTLFKTLDEWFQTIIDQLE